MKKKLFYAVSGLFVSLGLVLAVIKLTEGDLRSGLLGFLAPLFLLIPIIVSKLLGSTPYLLFIQGFIYCIIAFDIGYVAQLYGVIPHLDKIAHFYSGFIFTILGYCLFLLAHKNDEKPEGRPKYIGPLFALFFSSFVAVFWEICEFIDFNVTGNDGQNHLTTGVFDTMFDLIFCTIGSVICICSVLLYLYKGLRLPSGAIAHEFLEGIAQQKDKAPDLVLQSADNNSKSKSSSV